jgi:hypothetical protein
MSTPLTVYPYHRCWYWAQKAPGVTPCTVGVVAGGGGGGGGGGGCALVVVVVTGGGAGVVATVVSNAVGPGMYGTV